MVVKEEKSDKSINVTQTNSLILMSNKGKRKHFCRHRTFTKNPKPQLPRTCSLFKSGKQERVTTSCYTILFYL